MFRFLAAGDAGAFRYAGQLGVHVRTLNDAPVPRQSKREQASFFTVSSGGRSGFAGPSGWAVVAGPEIFGETAFRAFFSGETGTEALLTGRFEHTGTEPKSADKAGRRPRSCAKLRRSTMANGFRRGDIR